MAQLFKKDISIVIYTAKLRYFYEYELLTSDFIDTEKLAKWTNGRLKTLEEP